jgi:hypothetical protein
MGAEIGAENRADDEMGADDVSDNPGRCVAARVCEDAGDASGDGQHYRGADDVIGENVNIVDADDNGRRKDRENVDQDFAHCLPHRVEAGAGGVCRMEVVPI